ncbi:lysoplasmalogenase [Streptomyces sp. NPDC055078]
MSARRPRTAVRRRETLGLLLLTAFAVAVLADLGSLLLDSVLGHRVAKPLLMPLLAAYTAVRGGPRLLVAALLFGWGGDVFLLFGTDLAFVLGMASFAAGHLCYLAVFGRGRTPKGPLRLYGRGRTPRGLAPLYGVLLGVAVTLLWPGLPAGLRVPVAGYALLLTVMAWRASALGVVTGAGGALFLISDLIIATGVAGWPRPPVADFWIMLLYSTAQVLLTVGVLAARAPSRS